MKWFCYYLLLVAVILSSCKGEAPKSDSSKQDNPYPWVVGTWVGNWETYTFSYSSVNATLYCTARGMENEYLWDAGVALDKENNEFIIGNRRFAVSPKYKNLTYKGFPLINQATYKTSLEYQWLLGFWTNGNTYVSFNKSNEVSLYDFFGKPKQHGIFVINEDTLITIWDKPDKDNDWFYIYPNTKKLSYNGGAYLKKLTNKDEMHKAISENVEKRIYGEWRHTTEYNDTYGTLQFNKDKTGYEKLVIAHIPSYINFYWDVIEDRISIDTYEAHATFSYSVMDGYEHIHAEGLVYSRWFGYGKRSQKTFPEFEPQGQKPNKKSARLAKTLNLTAASKNENAERQIRNTIPGDFSVLELRQLGTIGLYDFLGFLKTKTTDNNATKIDSVKKILGDDTITVYYVKIETTDSDSFGCIYVVNSNNVVIGEVDNDKFEYGTFYKSFATKETTSINWNPWEE